MRLHAFGFGVLVLLAANCVAAPQRGASTRIDPAAAADIDSDGFVDDADFVLFSFQYDVLECNAPAMPDDCSADLNHDGLVDDADFVIFSHEYHRPPPSYS